MPIYIYYCEKCNTKGEYLVPLSNPVPEKCFECKRPGIDFTFPLRFWACR